MGINQFVFGKYLTTKNEIKHKWRQAITELKLKVAHGSRYPYFVICPQYFQEISKDTRVAIVDGIIGDVLAHNERYHIFNSGFNPENVGYSQEQFDELPEHVKHEIIEDWVLCAEVESDIKHNPIYSATARLSLETNCLSSSQEFLHHPLIDDSLSIEERIQAIDKELFIGSRCIVTNNKGRKSTGEVWVPNFRSPGFSGPALVMEIAELIALDKLKRNKYD